MNWYKICCPVDFSETSRVALEEAAGLARKYGSELTLLHVFEPAPASFEIGLMPPEHFEATSAELERKLGSWRGEAERISGGLVRSVVLAGPAAREICRFAREGGFDLVIVGTHGRTGLRHLVLGSVAEKVIREAHCPVLVVRPSPPQKR
jgi:nucleotide-binding universal stress UspA family protein